MLDRRDLLLDKLSALAQVTVTKQPDGTDTVTFGDAAKPLVEGTTVNWPQALTAAAGGQLGALLGLTAPGGHADDLPDARSTTSPPRSRRRVNALHTSTPFFTGNTAATLAVAVTPAEVQTSSTEAPGGNDVALAIAGAARRRGGTELLRRWSEQVGSTRQRRQGRTGQPADDA